MNKVAVITDSTAAIPDSIAREHNLTIVPLNLVWDGESYLDGIEITPVEFYERLVKSDTIPTTSQPSVGMFAKIFKNLIDQGYDILTIVISSKLSGTYQSAIQAAADFPKNRITVIDSLQASMPLSLAVLMTAQAAQRGATLLECTNLAKDLCQRVRILFHSRYARISPQRWTDWRRCPFDWHGSQDETNSRAQNGEIDSLENVRTFKKATERVFQIAETELGNRAQSSTWVSPLRMFRKLWVNLRTWRTSGSMSATSLSD